MTATAAGTTARRPRGPRLRDGRRVDVHMPHDLHARLLAAAVKNGRTAPGEVRVAVARHVERELGPPRAEP